MSALPTRRPPAARTDGAHHERPQRALRRGAGTLGAVLTVLLALLAPAGAGAQNPPEVSVSLVGGVSGYGGGADDKVPVLEGNGIRFALTRTGASTEKLAVGLEVTYNGSQETRTATFKAGEDTVHIDVTTVENEVVDDAHHSLTVTIRRRPAYQVSAESGTVSVVVPDDDIEISVRRASPSIDSVVEGGPEFYDFEASRNGDTSLKLKVEMFAQSDDGRTLPAVKVMNFPAGRESMQTQLRLPDNDYLHQADYTVTYGVEEISDPVEHRRYRRGDPHTATFRVLDDDLPRVGIEVAPGSGDEGTDFQITVTRDGTTAESLTVRLSVTDSGDFSELASSSVTFAVDAAKTTLILPTDDDEADGTLTVTLAADPAYRIGAGAGTRSVTVRDDDLPVVTMAPAANVIAEGETAEFVLTRSGDLSEPLTASTQFLGRPEGHFGLEPTTRRDVTFTAGSATATLSGATIDDDRYFAYREVLAVLLQESGRYRIALPGPDTFHVWALIYNNVTSGIYNRLIVTDDDEGRCGLPRRRTAYRSRGSPASRCRPMRS